MHFKDAYKLITEKIASWIELIVTMLPNAVVAIVVVIIFYFIAKLVRTLSGKILSKAFNTKSLNHFIQTIIYIVIIVIGLFIALGVLDLDKTVTSLLAGIGVLGLALGFAFQDTAANFVAGIFLAVRSPIEIGDIVESVNITGVVHRINLMATEVKTFKGTHVIIPNKEVFQNPVFNFTQNGKRRIVVDCGISYKDNLNFVKEVAIEAVKNTDNIIHKDKVTFYYTAFAESSINFQVTAWTSQIDQTKFLEVQSNMIINIKQAFDANDISIPFPIRTIDFGKNSGVQVNLKE